MAIGQVSTRADKLRLGRIALIAAAVYLAAVAVFYWLAGDQLHYRASRNNIPMPTAETAAAELSRGVTVEQAFTPVIDRLESVSVQWGTYYRQNSGTVTMALYTADGEPVLSQTFDAAQITDGGVLTMAFPSPREGLLEAPLVLRLTADSPAGAAAAPMMTWAARSDGALTVNGAAVDGALCFSVSGQEFIWLGLHYWTFCAVFGAALGVFLALSYRGWRKGRTNLLVNVVLAMKRYRFLIKQLVNRDFKTKYKRSVLGVFWSFLNPLLTMVVQYVVFSKLFRFDVPHYPVYLLAGIVMFNYFSEACTLTLGSITGNRSLITKVYMPKYIYPLTRVLSSLINLAISMIPLLCVALLSGLVPTRAYLLVLYPMACLTVFCLGLGMLLATSMVFFQDTQFLWGVLSMVWMYLTPVFYPASILPDRVAALLKFNPMYHYVTFVRTCIMSGVSPEPRTYVACLVYALLMLAVGALVFKKNQDSFVLYL